jgi:hypothetical protein
MNRDTATAMWYRRIDRHCFAASKTPPEAGTSHARSTRGEPAEPGRSGSDGWRTMLNDTRVWMPETVTDRL